jgi:hypothetical protein
MGDECTPAHLSQLILSSKPGQLVSDRRRYGLRSRFEDNELERRDWRIGHALRCFSNQPVHFCHASRAGSSR